MKQRAVYIQFLYVLIVLCALLTGCKSKQQRQVKENEYYVCSMDPQVMEKHPGMCPICKMPLTKATVNPDQMKGIQLSDEQMKLANIKVESAADAVIGRGLTLNGTFALNQNKTEQISARIRGRLDHLYFKVVGKSVNKGDKLYDLYSQELLEAQEEYLLAIEKGKLLKASGANIVAAARNKLVLWGLGEAQINELERTGKPRIVTTVYSKVSGTVTEIPVKEGDYVNEGAEVYKVADLSSLWVEAQIYTNEFGYLQDGKQVDVIPESYPDERIKGNITFANPELQQQSKVNIVRVEVNNASMRLRPGMQAYVVLNGEEKHAMVLPIDAVLQNANSSTIWVETQKNIFMPRAVTTGIQNDEKVEITSGLKTGEMVVVSGAYLLNSEYIFKNGMNPMNKNDTKAKVETNMPGMKM